MKVLHTSDWHLGHTLYNYDRTNEQKAMLTQMAEIVRKEKPDVFLLCGDVYHTAQPSAAVQKMFSDELVNIRKANPNMIIVMTAGNHDSGSKHEIFRTPWLDMQVYAVGQINKDKIDEHIIEVKGKGFIIAVPYCNERNIPEGLFTQLTDAVSKRNTEDLPVIMSAHTTVKGCDFTGHDNILKQDSAQNDNYIVGGIDTIDIDQFGNGYDYLALGHIHHAQFVHTGNHNVRYSGSPIAVSFDENYSHSVSIVEIDSHNNTPKVTEIEINNPKPLVTLPTEGMATWEEAKKLLRDFPDNIPAYIRLNVENENFLPVEANLEANNLTKEKECYFCYINAKRKSTQQTETKDLSIQEFQKESPINIAQRYAEDTGITFDNEMIELFKETVKMVEEQSRNN